MTLPGDVLPESLWDSVRHNHRRLLMLDYDGTLVPFRERRDEAYLDQDSLDLLRAIAITTQLAIISGRPAADLERFLPLPILRVAEHGWEEITVAGGHIVHPLPERAGVALQAAYETAAANDFVQFLERKRCSLVLHTRGLPAAHARSLEAL